MITECHLISEELTLGINNEHTLERVYHAKSDSRAAPTSIAAQLFTATPDPVPQPLTQLDFSTYVQTVNVKSIKDGNASLFVITVTAGKLPSDQDPSNPTVDGQQDPMQAKTVLWVETMATQELITRDRDGKPLLNSADQEFDDAIIEDDEIPVIVWQKNYATYQEILTINKDYRRTHNSTTFLGFPSETARFLSLQSGAPQYYNGTPYYTGTGRIAVKADGWIKWIVDQGAEYYDKPKSQAGAKRVNAVDALGQLANGNVLLATDGTKLPAGQIGHGLGFYILTGKNYGPLIANP